MSVDPVEAQNCANQPADGTEKCESNVCLPFGTGIDTVERDAGPVENIAASSVKPVHDQTEGHKPSNADEEVGGPVDEGSRKWEEPYDREDNRQPCYYFGVDETSLIPGRATLDRVEVVARQTGDNSGEG